jgi:hypothetical protein
MRVRRGYLRERLHEKVWKRRCEVARGEGHRAATLGKREAAMVEKKE